MSKSMIRAQRAARRVPYGAEILEFLGGQKGRKALLAAANAGEPPVAAISKDFATLVGGKNAKSTQVKQFVGMCVRAILEEEGFEIDRTGVWLGNDPVFSTGSVYRKIKAASGARAYQIEFLERFAQILSEEEVVILEDFLSRRRKK